MLDEETNIKIIIYYTMWFCTRCFVLIERDYSSYTGFNTNCPVCKTNLHINRIRKFNVPNTIYFGQDKMNGYMIAKDLSPEDLCQVIECK